MLRLGSLFSGSGGFELAGSLCDVEPRWASEVEPYPIAVTRSRFPNMKHLGDISKVNGAEIEPVDIITFGSPCQDLSVAGKRAGLKHESNGDEETTRSGLFMEAVRIIKEMREATNGEYPRFALWENVPGAFSSNKGEDFRIVLEELIKIVEPTAAMPEVPKNGWAYADSHVGNGWSIAYRVFDAQYWGVPQRRRRIHLVADLRGTSAREVLFEREGVRGYFAQGGTPWESLAAYAEGSVGADHREGECSEDSAALKVYGIDHAITTGGNCTAQGPCVYEDVQATLKAAGPHSVAYTLKIRSGCEGGGKGALVQTDKSATLATNNDQYLFQPISFGVVSKGNGEAWCIEEKHMALSTGGGQAGQGFPCTMCPVIDEHILDDQGGQQITVRSDGKVPTLRAEMHGNIPCVLEASGVDGYNSTVTGDKAATLGVNCGTSTGRNGVVITESAGFKELNSAEARSIGYGQEVAPTLSAGKHDASVCVGVLASSAVNAEQTDGRISPCLMARAGTGGNQLPLVAVKSWDARGNGDGDTISTITGDHENRITDYSSVICMATQQGGAEIRMDDKAPTVTAAAGMSGNNQPVVCYENEPIPIHDQATRFSGKRGDKSDGKGNGLGVGSPGDSMNTLTGGDRHAVAYAMQGFGDYKDCGVASGIKARDYKDATDLVVDSAGVDCRNMNEYPELYPTLQAKPNGGQSLNFSGAVRIRYIVRRLTPTECARLQGFADCWGHIGEKEDFTDEEYRFWLDVRNTHAEINGKVVKDYTKKQMLTWYNKLHTDSAEYKMWGNGIALPPALYCMQGITDVLKRN